MLKLNILLSILEQRNTSIQEFSRQIGISAQTIRRIVKNNSTRIQTLERIANGLNLPITTFFGSGTQQYIQTKPHIPVAAQAGTLGSYSQAFHSNECDHFHIIPGFANYDFTITVQGNSMQPEYNEGDVVACRFINNLHEVHPKDTYLVDCSEGIVIKQLHISETLIADELIECISLNPVYSPFKVSLNDIYTVAKVVGVIKNC